MTFRLRTLNKKRNFISLPIKLSNLPTTETRQKFWNKTSAPPSFWKDTLHRRLFFDWLGQQLGYVSLNCWYSISHSDFKRHGGSGLLSHYYKDCIYNAVNDIYAEYPWIPWRFNYAPHKFWSNSIHRRSFFDQLGQELGYVSLSHWYDISLSVLNRYGGYGLLSSHYNNSVYNALIEVYPEYTWLPWKLNLTPKNFWSDLNRRRSYFDWLGKELGYETFRDWYEISVSDLNRNGGSGLLSGYYNNSVYNALLDVYPEYPWITWKFNRAPQKFWLDFQNQREFVLELGKELGYSDFSDFYRLGKSDLLTRGYSRFFSLYNNSIYRCLKSVFPEFDWLGVKFNKTPQINVAPRVLDSQVFSISSIKSLEDWYRIPISSLNKFGIYNKTDLIQALKKKYPDFKWNTKRFLGSTGKKMLQWKLRRILEQVFETKSLDTAVLEDYWGLDMNMELDIFVPSLNLAFEYQGFHHFRNHYFFGPTKDYKLRDEKKRVSCKRVGITLIEVPYSLTLDEVSFADLVRRSRPDILV